MKTSRFFITSLVVPALFVSAEAKHQIATPKTNSDFERRMKIIPTQKYNNFVALLNNSDEADAMKFLYSYMSLPDITDYSPEFYLENVRTTLQAAEDMPWGKTVPDREFRHFVLPVRVNNENLDMSRPAFYKELKNRVKGLSMEDAILEVNHWCHEKVTYQPSDARTSSPLNTVKNALGRCGEESTFTVAALRSVGIPARQIYTPRWAHTDDNHAWVEAWANGKWYFLGACEPEPVLNLGWFNSPASRGMLMSTNVYGYYDGPEEVLGRNNIQTSINVTSNYAPTAIASVKVLDRNGKPVDKAKVNFCLYNYAEFFPIATKTTDKQGAASLQTGRGDMIVWASDGTNFGYGKITSGNTKPLEIRLDRKAGDNRSAEFDIVPPLASANAVELTDKMIAENNRRKAIEDSIRNAYTSTFHDSISATAFVKEHGLIPGAAEILIKSRGNHKNIEEFLISTRSEGEKAVGMLKAMAEKDLHDTPAEVLQDHFSTAPSASELYTEYILNPRIDVESLTPYKKYFGEKIAKKDREKYQKNPELWAKWVNDNIRIDNAWNPGRLRMSPRAVWENRLTDPRSRNIFFVATARSMGIPARIDKITGKTQYADKAGNWIDVNMGQTQIASQSESAPLRLNFTKTGRIEDPRYYSAFTISRIDNGAPRLMEYDEFEKLSNIQSKPNNLDYGQYLLVSGQRMADGSVLARTELFNIDSKEGKEMPLVIRQDTTGIQVIGNFNAENLYTPIEGGDPKTLISTTGRGYYVLGIISPNHEPSSHALNDIAAVKNDLEKWNGKIMVLLKDKDASGRFDKTQYGTLPSNVVIGTDTNGTMTDEICASLGLKTKEMPLFIITDTFNRIVFVQQGYSIGLGEKIMNVFEKLK